mgnify:FL=1|jgi:competence protein comEA helix-hairpin-helix repeat region
MMKKIIVLLFLLIIFYGELHYVDLRQFQSESKQVEVKGEVKKPGIYEVAIHASVEEILTLAGGCTKEGDTSNLNLTLDIENHGVIVVGKHQATKLISINSASLEELDELKGVGPSIAQRIIDYRNQQPFKTLEELKNVKGIGDRMFEKIKGQITL